MSIEDGYKHFHEIPYRVRFTEAVRHLVGAEPPAELVDAWINDVDRDDDLCQWVGSAPNTPSWTQNIAVLDAASVLASNPCEGAI
jgi:hypothetical protein